MQLGFFVPHAERPLRDAAGLQALRAGQKRADTAVNYPWKDEKTP